jgi:large subunit ribosomal protein L24
MAGVKIRKGDTVQVISGKDKGTTGRVLVVDPETQRVIVEGVNRVVKHTKVGQGGPGRQDRRPDPHRGADPRDRT